MLVIVAPLSREERGKAPMLITDERQKPPIAEPELLIEEARQRHRHRLRRRNALVGAAALVVVAVGIAQLARGGSGHHAAQSPPAIVFSSSTPTVIYEDLEVGGATFQTWIVSNKPLAWRATVPGKPWLEFGEGAVRDPLMGREDAVFLYDARTNTIYRTGTYPLPSQRLATSPEAIFRRLLAQPGVHLTGTGSFAGHQVDRIAWSYASAAPARNVLYVDAHSYVPVFFLQRIGSGPPNLVVRAPAWKTLAATAANLKHTSLAAAHPGARVIQAPPHIQALYEQLAGPVPLYWDELTQMTPPGVPGP
jgi:hypothetical protein